MAILSPLPDGVCMDILSQWCLSNDLTFLDSAFCNKTERNWLLENIFQSTVFTLNEGECVTRISLKNGAFHSYSFSVFTWIYLRKLKPKSIAIIGNYFQKVICWRAIDTSKVKSLRILHLKHALSDVDLIFVVNGCTALTNLHLTIKNISDNLIRSIEPTILRQLESLKLAESESTLTQTGLLHLNLINTPNLTAFSYAGSDLSHLLTEQDFCDFIKQRTDLTDIAVYDVVLGESFLLQVENSCKQLKHLNIGDYGTHDWNPICVLYAHFPSIEELTVWCIWCGVEYYADQKRLEIAWFEYEEDEQERILPDDLIRKLSMQFTDLHSITFTTCFLCEETARLIAKLNSRLQNVKIGGLLNISAVKILLRACHHLSIVLFSHIETTSSEWIELFAAKNNLKSVSFDCCSNLQSVTVINILKLNPQITKLGFRSYCRVDRKIVEKHLNSVNRIVELEFEPQKY